MFMGGERLPHRVRIFLDFMVPRLRHYLATGGGNRDDRRAAHLLAAKRQSRTIMPDQFASSENACPAFSSGSAQGDSVVAQAGLQGINDIIPV